MAYSPQQLAESFIKAGELQDALDTLDAHLRDGVTDDDARRLRAELLCRRPDPADQSRALADLNALQAPRADDYFMRGVICERLNRADDALAALRTGHDRFPDDARLTERCLHHLRARDMLDEAHQLLDDLPHGWRRDQWAGDLAVATGDHAAAVAHYDSALNTLTHRYNIGEGGHTLLDPLLSDASTLTIAAICGRLHLAHGHALLALNRPDDADASYARARSLLPYDPAITFHRGRVLARKGDIAAAHAHYAEALADASPFLRQHLLDSLTPEDARGFTPPDFTGA